MPQESRDALEHARGVRDSLGQFTAVPTTWEGWAVRVMTVVMAILLVTNALTIAQLREVQEFIETSRVQRLDYQQVQSERTCLIIRTMRIDPTSVRDVRC